MALNFNDYFSYKKGLFNSKRSFMSSYVWGDNVTQFFYELGPETVLSAVESLGFKTTGRCLPLNSMENRVYEIEIDLPVEKIKSESERFLIAKFYRPGRWTKEQIQEEHQFLMDLEKAEIPAIAPLIFQGKTLFKVPGQEIFFTLFPKKGGRAPQDMSKEQLQILGRLLARVHTIGEQRPSQHRLKINTLTFGRQNLDYLLKENFIPEHLKKSFTTIFERIDKLVAPAFEKETYHRIHGDCHWGNIIWRDQEGPFFIDFDDMLCGPAIQDIWLIVPGEDKYALKDREIFLEAYQSMRPLSRQSLKLIEPLRTLRYIHFAAWIAKRSKDPAFINAFPHFYEANYWEELLQDLRLQYVKIQETFQNSFEDSFNSYLH